MTIFTLPHRHLRTEQAGQHRHTKLHVLIRVCHLDYVKPFYVCSQISYAVPTITLAVYNSQHRNVQIYSHQNVKSHTTNVCWRTSHSFHLKKDSINFLVNLTALFQHPCYTMYRRVRLMWNMMRRGCVRKQSRYLPAANEQNNNIQYLPSISTG